MNVPGYFLTKIEREFGDAGRAWLQQIPAIVERCQQVWRLTDCTPIDDLTVNLVCFCTSEIHGDAVLKIQGPHSERYTEIEALRLYDGRHCCRLMALDLDSAAMLLQRARPGLRLRDLPECERQLAIGAEMIGRLPIALPPHHALPSYSGWLDRAAAKLARAPDTMELRALLETAREFFRDVGAESELPVLLHGDLHHDNILQAGTDAWIAVDPQGVTGARFLEAGRFIQNHALWGRGPMDEDKVVQTVQYVADHIDQPWTRLAKALFILHTLTVCWCWEAGEEQAELWRMGDQCVQIQSLIRQY